MSNKGPVTFVPKLPRPNVRSYDWVGIQEALRANPEQWALIEGHNIKGTNASAQATTRNINWGRIAGMAKGEFEATTRGTKVYARYVGKNPSDD